MFEQFATTLFTVSGVVYGLVEVFKPIWDPTKRQNVGDVIAAGVLGVAICLAAQVDAFPVIGLPLVVPYLGSVLTGFLMVGGGKVIHDLIALLKARKIGG